MCTRGEGLDDFSVVRASVELVSFAEVTFRARRGARSSKLDASALSMLPKGLRDLIESTS